MQPGPWMSFGGRSGCDSMCQVTEALRQRATRHAPEDGSADEEEVGWLVERLVYSLIRCGMPG